MRRRCVFGADADAAPRRLRLVEEHSCDPPLLLFALIVVRRSADGITLPLRVDGLRLGLEGRVKPDVFRLQCALPSARTESAVQWCHKQCAGQQMASSDAGRFVRSTSSMSSSAHKQEEVGAAQLAPDGQDDLAP